MKKQVVLFFAAIFVLISLISCGNKKQVVTNEGTDVTEAEKPDFFPVTNYIKGQISQIATNPLKFTTVKGKTDSAWVKTEAYNKVFEEFLTPEIDSARMEPFFKETKFADKTLGTYTFTYEPRDKLPAEMILQRWDVYVDFKTNTVKNIFIEKKKNEQTVQLLWNDKTSCKIVYINTDKNGNPTVEKEELIRWDF